jgi:hypothetical protein
MLCRFNDGYSKMKKEEGSLKITLTMAKRRRSTTKCKNSAT